jgi:predicted DNA-binding protein (MmcQ/YjbR family)
MDIEEFRNYCLKKNGVSEGLPFGPDTLVFKVSGKIFALCGLEPFEGVNLKCDPLEAIGLREQFEGIKPGYHMNKQHWNTVAVESDVSNKLLRILIDKSYDLVVSGLSRKQQLQLDA